MRGHKKWAYVLIAFAAVYMALLIIFPHNGALKPLYLLFGLACYGFLIAETKTDMEVYEKIFKNGVRGQATIGACDEVYNGYPLLHGFSSHQYEVCFYLGGVRRELKLFGRYSDSLGQIGNVIDVIYWDQYPDLIISADEAVLASMKRHTAYTGGVSLFIFVLLFAALAR